MVSKFKTVLAIIAILVSFSLPAFSATSLSSYEPYRSEEFPTWMHKARRAEIIALGATALTYPIVGLVMQNQGVATSSETKNFLKQFGISLSLGAVIATIDYILGEVK